ncbi:MAG: hypothetical protein Kow00121_67360 [Elainellaceae cyanobacterium]
MMNIAVYSHGQSTYQVPKSRVSNSTIPDLDVDDSQNVELPALLQGVVESLIDGIMILNDQGDLIFANSHAKRICCQLTQNLSRRNLVPRQIWRSCQTLIKSCSEFPGESIVIEDEIKTKEASAIRLRARWLDLTSVERPCLLIALEDQQQSAHFKAIAEAQKYGLTERETEVWMLKRAGHTYKAIAAELHIAEDTVKKHVKSIYSKREGAEWLGEA